MAQWNRHLTVLDLCKRVCGQLGLPVPIAVVSQTNDKLATQLLYLLNKVGPTLLKPVHGYRWQQFQKTWELATVPGQTEYDLPEDWDSFIDNTANSSSLAMPLLGPVAPPSWNRMRAWTSGPVISLVYRTRGGKFQLFHSPAEAQNVIIDYSSRGWVQQMADPVGLKDVVDRDDDVILYDADLIQAALKLYFLREKGFDTTTAQNDYDLALELAINADTDAPIINAAGSRGMPLIDTCNLPQSGYGG